MTCNFVRCGAVRLVEITARRKYRKISKTRGGVRVLQAIDTEERVKTGKGRIVSCEKGEVKKKSRISVALPESTDSTRDTSNLLAHEATFALGQMQDAEAIPALETVVNDFSLHPIVRHEAAEALGAIAIFGTPAMETLKSPIFSTLDDGLNP